MTAAATAVLRPTPPRPLTQTVAARALKAQAKRSPCRRLKVAAILVDVDTGDIVGTGMNGPPPGFDPCTTCLREEQGIEPGTRVEIGMCVHAEWNAILNAGRSTARSRLLVGSIDPKTGYLTDREPCPICARLLLAAGVRDPVEIVTEHGSRTASLRDIVGGTPLEVTPL